MLMDTASPTMINAKFFTVTWLQRKWSPCLWRIVSSQGPAGLCASTQHSPGEVSSVSQGPAEKWQQCFTEGQDWKIVISHPQYFSDQTVDMYKGADWKENNWKSQGKEAGLGFNARVAPLSNVQWVYSFHIRPKEGVKFGEYRSSANWHSPGKGVNEQCFTCEIFDRIPPVHAHAQRFTLWIPSTQWWSGMGEHGWQVKDPNQPTLLHCRKLPSDCWHCWKRWREKKIQIW